MRGIHDGPDCTTWPDDKPDPKRGRALLIVVVALGLVAGVVALAGVQDGPDGVDPLGKHEGSVFGAIVDPLGPDTIYMHAGGLNDASMSCSSEQQNVCERKCQDATKPGEVLYSSKCEKKLRPVGPMPGVLMYYDCTCTWVKSPTTAQR